MISKSSTFVMDWSPLETLSHRRTEICEHKGIGHPDTICDGAADAVSRALSLAYLREYGCVQHHNVDKALLVAGNARPRFGGGEILASCRLIIAGRVSPLPGRDTEEVVHNAARDYLAGALRCGQGMFLIEPAIHNGSSSLRRVFSQPPSQWLANDTSFGAGFSPLSQLETATLRLAATLRSSDFRDTYPAAGDDFKIMGARIDERLSFTVAVAFVDRHVANVTRYFEIKKGITAYLQRAVALPCTVSLNALDDPNAVDETGVYLTVSGLSAEQGDDGQVGRGNRVNGLITPCRTMSLEAAAGKNPVAHVGKLYNVLAAEMARAISSGVEGVREASVQLLSTIGKPVTEPDLIAIRVLSAREPDSPVRNNIERIVRSCLERTDEISRKLIHGELPVF